RRRSGSWRRGCLGVTAALSAGEPIPRLPSNGAQCALAGWRELLQFVWVEGTCRESHPKDGTVVVLAARRCLADLAERAVVDSDPCGDTGELVLRGACAE